MIYACSTCGSKILLPQVCPTDIHAERGHLWHRPCASIVDGKLAEFPSEGKLIPETILTPLEVA
jgi:hypothetical protein